MFGTLKGRILVILAVLATAGWYLYSNGLKLGLDLQGGMHLALEVSDPEGTFTPETRADATDRALKIIRTRIDEFGVEEPLIQKVGADRIIVELAGIRDEERAKGIIQQTAYLEFKLVRDGQELLRALPRIDRAVVEALGPEALTERARADRPGEAVEELLFGRQDTARADAAQEDTTDAAEAEARPFSALLLDSGVAGELLVAEADVPTLTRYLALPEVQRAMPRDVELLWAAEPTGRGAQLYRTLFVLEEDPFMTGEALENATAGRDPQFNQTIVSFELNRRGGRTFESVTGEHIGDRIAIVLDDEVYSAPVVEQRIATSGVIRLGQAPLEEANDLALVLRAGALPAPLDIIEERVVGPSLGADSVAKGKVAGIVGVILVIAIMVGYYRFSGALSIIALGVYTIIVLGGMAALNATLTAPGIAGLILSIGMAVDANVLIFERIREELAAGRTIRMAVDEGFSNAMSAIVDSNITTLLTALILYRFGTGPVQGFAVTLSIGIIASFFSAVYVTRTLFLLYLQRKRAVEALSI
ncbi:MAG TPA: protein translocase subunit SecD [Longimicrobiales bacterium]